MTIKIVLVNSNLKHNGDNYPKGSVAQFEIEAMQSLVDDGTLRVLDVETIAEGFDLVAKEEADRIEKEENAAGVVQEQKDTFGPTGTQNTFGPKDQNDASAETTDEKKEETTDKVETLTKFKVLKDFEVKNPESKNFGSHAPGSIIEADAIAAQSLVDDGILEIYTPEKVETGDSLDADKL